MLHLNFGADYRPVSLRYTQHLLHASSTSYQESPSSLLSAGTDNNLRSENHYAAQSFFEGVAQRVRDSRSPMLADAPPLPCHSYF